MHTRYAAIKTGLVVVLASIALLGLIYFATGGTWFKEWRYYRLRIDPGPLAPREGDPISINGVDAGKVMRVYFANAPVQDPSSPGEQEIVVEVRARIEAGRPLPTDTKGVISESITGQRSLHLLLGREKAFLKGEEDGDEVLHVRQAPDMTSIATRFEEVAEQAKVLVTKVDTVAGNANTLMTTAVETVQAIKERVERGDIDLTLKNIAEATGSLKNFAASLENGIDPIIANVKDAAAKVNDLAATGVAIGASLKDDLAGLMVDVRGIASRVDGIVASAEPKIAGFFDDVEKVGHNVVRLSDELAQAGPEVREILQAAGRDVDELMEILKDTGYNLADASEDIRAHPWKLLNEPEADQIAYENLRTTMQNYVRSMYRVDRAAETVRQAMALDPQSTSATALLQRALASLDGSLDKYRQVEAELMQLLEKNRPPPPAAGARAAPPPTVRTR